MTKEQKRLKPKQIDIEVTSHCNLSCKLCPINEMQLRPNHLDKELFKSIIDRAVKETPQSTIVPWLNGEPLLHPDYAELITYISKNGLRYYITTNGTRWDQEVFDHITSPESTCYQLIFSLDGVPFPNSRSIETARPGTDRNVVLSTIEDVLKLKRKKGSDLIIALKLCNRGQDWAEIEEYIGYWLSREEVDYVCIGKALDKINEKSMRIYPCQYSDNNFMVIKSDGRVTLCAYNLEATNNPVYTMGDVFNKEEPLLSIYNNKQFQLFRENQRRGIFQEPCKSCGFAYTGQGFKGKITFREDNYNLGELYYHEDYYNKFFSKKGRRKNDSYYKQGYEGGFQWIPGT